MKYGILILFLTCPLPLWATSNSTQLESFNSSSREIIFNSCMPVEIEYAKESGKDEPTAIAYNICKVVSSICSDAEKYLKSSKPCNEDLLKYDNELRSKGNSLLHLAAYYGRTDLIKTLIGIGVDLNMQQEGYKSSTFGKGWSSLMLASAEGHIDVVLQLIQAGANVNLENAKGRTALMFSSNYGFYSIVRELLGHGADPNIVPTDDTGWTALIAASFNGNVDIVKLLLQYNPNVHIKDHEGKTALNRAEERGHLEIMQLLRN